MGLNPYFNGTCSKSDEDNVLPSCFDSLNPYFNGTCSKSDEDNVLPSCFDSLNPYFNGTCSKSITNIKAKRKWKSVLILILMEHAQRGRFQLADYSCDRSKS